jgi:phenylacetate-CoA ligase
MTDPSHSPLLPLHSAIPGIVWPAVPGSAATTVLAVLHQLEQSQWLDHDRLSALQLRQLDGVLRHAYGTCDGYRRRWAGFYEPEAPLSYERFARLPLLARRALQDGFDELCSRRTPAAHGEPIEQRTSGSTAAPVRLLTTRLSGLFWNAITLRDHLWHGRDFRRKLAVIRRESEQSTAPNWGAATAGLVTTGPAVGNSIRTDAATLLNWLQREQPGYLFTYPSLVTDLARLSIERRIELPGLLEVRTFAESLGPDVRELCREAWGVPLTDMYSATESGYLALQCPDHAHYHVQSEGVLLEVLDDRGTPCEPGQVGRVVVTSLHNFAMPLVRYDIGDYAEVGAPCSCGRGLPVLTRILGRVRNMLVTADGKRYWPVFGTRALMDSTPVLQYQFVQTTPQRIDAHLVVSAPLSADQEAMFRERVMSQLPHGIDVQIVYCDRIERSAGGKYEEFLSELTGQTSKPARA